MTWQTIECERVLYAHCGKTVILCDRLPSPVTLIIKTKDETMTPEQLAASGTEHGHQVALFAWAAFIISYNDVTHSPKYKLAQQLKLMFAIPNGGLRHKAEANKLKSEGVKSGVPDIFLPVCKMPKGAMAPTQSGLFIEMKKPNEKPKHAGAGGVSSNQAAWHTALRAQGYQVAICYSWQEASDVILAYLGVN